MRYSTMIELRLPNLDKKEINDILKDIAAFLCEKARQENKKQDDKNKTLLASISFWFANTEDGQGYLVYDSNPNNWDKNIIKQIKIDMDYHNWRVMLDSGQLWQ